MEKAVAAVNAVKKFIKFTFEHIRPLIVEEDQDYLLWRMNSPEKSLLNISGFTDTANNFYERRYERSRCVEADDFQHVQSIFNGRVDLIDSRYNDLLFLAHHFKDIALIMRNNKRTFFSGDSIRTGYP